MQFWSSILRVLDYLAKMSKLVSAGDSTFSGSATPKTVKTSTKVTKMIKVSTVKAKVTFDD